MYDPQIQLRTAPSGKIKTKRSYTQVDSRKQVYSILEQSAAKQIEDKSSKMLKMSTESMY